MNFIREEIILEITNVEIIVQEYSKWNFQFPIIQNSTVKHVGMIRMMTFVELVALNVDVGLEIRCCTTWCARGSGK